MRDALSGDKLMIALFGELSLEEAMDLSQDRQILELIISLRIFILVYNSHAYSEPPF
jgi:hypothetical protein